jgi:hypothetical protein
MKRRVSVVKEVRGNKGYGRIEAAKPVSKRSEERKNGMGYLSFESFEQLRFVSFREEVSRARVAKGKVVKP